MRAARPATSLQRSNSTTSRYAEVFAADLIVMGTHGRRGLKHFLLGSVAEVVLREASIPVLVVRSGVPSEVKQHGARDAKYRDHIEECSLEPAANG